MGNATTITERDNAGRTVQIHVGSGGINAIRMGVSPQGARHRGRLYFIDLLARMFLPAGYPNSVSPDYLRYQILNALQAFCNSLASLLSSRATLQGFGVGDPTATPTKALLLTVLQDVFSRLTTILSAHLLGSYLYPEAKTYRLLADVLNDTAVILDTLSPVFNTFPIPGLRRSDMLHRPENLDALDAIQTGYNTVSKHLPDFTAKLQSAGWNTVDCALVTGSPDAVVTAVTSSASDLDAEEKKFR
ncbi:vitamin B6 photo-protection and homoeostasis-domain-containing protein [Flammula alnicola]|nr:vitamin B6 photo-protection and homoeostasis-domain-containing protein [Flammula alnicola]